MILYGESLTKNHGVEIVLLNLFIFSGNEIFGILMTLKGGYDF